MRHGSDRYDRNERQGEPATHGVVVYAPPRRLSIDTPRGAGRRTDRRAPPNSEPWRCQNIDGAGVPIAHPQAKAYSTCPLVDAGIHLST